SRPPPNRGRDGPGGRALATVSEPRGELPVRVRVRERNEMNPADRNRVGIIGAGRIGQAMTRTALRAGRSVVIANSRGPESLTSLVDTHPLRRHRRLPRDGSMGALLGCPSLHLEGSAAGCAASAPRISRSSVAE